MDIGKETPQAILHGLQLAQSLTAQPAVPGRGIARLDISPSWESTMAGWPCRKHTSPFAAKMAFRRSRSRFMAFPAFYFISATGFVLSSRRLSPIKLVMT